LVGFSYWDISRSEELGPCGEEYVKMCQINHPFCEIYNHICSKEEEKEIFKKYEEGTESLGFADGLIQSVNQE